MGYILPIENYQQQIYLNRTKKNTKSHYAIEKPFQSQFDMDYNNERTIHQPSQEESGKRTFKQFLLAEQAKDTAVQSGLSSKGNYVNARV